MNTSKPWLIYGATGFTGEMIVAEAVQRGQAPKLAGRSPEKIRAQAEKFGLEWTAFPLTDRQALSQAVGSSGLVLLAAGPFSVTSAPVLEACLEAGVPYLDLSNDISEILGTHAHDQQARQRGIALISGVGFGVTASSSLAKFTTDLLPGATELEISISLYTARTSEAAAQSGIEVLSQGGKVYRGGKLISQLIGSGAKKMAFPDGRHSFVPVASGDLAAAYLTTGVPDISVSMDLGIDALAAHLVLPAMQAAASIPPIRRRLAARRKADSLPAAPDQQKRTYLWAQAQAPKGKKVQAWLELGEGYDFSAASAVLAVEETLKSHPVGALTPAQAFGTSFIQKIDGVKLHRANE